jgi:hypothetical protein
MTNEQSNKTCLACQRDAQSVPLLTLDYMGSQFSICPQHLPILIHDPRQLVGKLPGAENMSPADHED